MLILANLVFFFFFSDSFSTRVSKSVSHQFTESFLRRCCCVVSSTIHRQTVRASTLCVRGRKHSTAYLNGVHESECDGKQRLFIRKTQSRAWKCTSENYERKIFQCINIQLVLKSNVRWLAKNLARFLSRDRNVNKIKHLIAFQLSRAVYSTNFPMNFPIYLFARQVSSVVVVAQLNRNKATFPLIECVIRVTGGDSGTIKYYHDERTFAFKHGWIMIDKIGSGRIVMRSLDVGMCHDDVETFKATRSFRSLAAVLADHIWRLSTMKKS